METAALPSASPAGATASTTTMPQLARPQAKPLSTWVFWSFLLALTLGGAFLRFWRLDFQAYWTDEGYTINRIRGTYSFLLSQLVDQGFPPGWYAMLRLWRVFGQEHLHMAAGDTYQPGYLRLLPAFFGTLMVPAMCFLGRQFTDRKGALLVALLTAVNPFLIYYARDIKMYACLYFFVALNMALFFQWQTTRKHLLWYPLFLLSGLALMTLHPMACVILALQLIFILTRPRPKGWDAPLWLLAAGAMAIIPLDWYYFVNSPAQFEARISLGKGMNWFSDYTDMSWSTAAGLPTAHILGYLWPAYPPDEHLDNWFLLGGKDFTQHLATRTWAWLAHGELYAGIGLFAVMVLGLIPWRRWRATKLRPATPAAPAARADGTTNGRWWWVLLWIVLPAAAMACTWIPTLPQAIQTLDQQQQERARMAQSLDRAQSNLAALPADSNQRPATQAEVKRCQADLQRIDGELDVTRRHIESDWYDRLWTWTGQHPEPMWEPRYLGIIVPAWLLWLAAALRRFPTWPLRTLLITATAGVCTFSALSNHLFYRNAPLNREAAILEKYIDPHNRLSAAVAVPQVRFPDPAEDTATTIARHVVPAGPQDDYLPRNRAGRDASFWPMGLTLPNQYANWLRTSVANNPRVNLLVMTDRNPDLPAADDPISNDAVAKILGPRWKLIDEERYEWHYEWRFYIFHTWRTRVWKLQ